MASHYQYEMGPEQMNTEPRSENPPLQRYTGAPATNFQNGTYNMPPTASAAANVKPALPRRRSQQSDHDLKKQLHDLHQTLNAEVSKNKEYQDLLSQSNKKMDELNQFLSEAEDEVEEYKALWKQSASELNSHLVNDRGFKSIDDKFFIDEITLLRRNIRDFAYQYYDDWPVGNKVGPVNDIANILDLNRDRPPLDVTQAEHEERNRQIDLWRARTSTLLQDPLSRPQSNEQKASQEKLFRELKSRLINLLPPNVKSKDVGKQVEAIWNDSISLDMALNTQASGLHLYYARRRERPMKFESATMEEELEGDGSPSSDTVTCILAPSLRRSGESDGTPLAKPACLVKMLVSCQAGDTRTRGQQKTEEKDHGRQGAVRTNARRKHNVNS
ncbi:hypothetical protein FPOAC1_004267 [Fusarium poae]|uniref:hypothetical protein n=1 Tax=Fusarium poae TaxID=36050 RepID=UPI001CEBAE8D|nr:hypothetical protein FPOAC1_004267 [Fusarium poae]KAG8671030.1 hypothetical protein FPOAC1_004267 [Fusarium poae]